MILGVVLCCSPRLYAEGSPPLITDDPGTPPKGHWEINLGVSTERHSGLQQSELPLLDLNYGLADTVQLKFEVPFLLQSEAGEGQETGWGNPEVGVKWRFLDHGEGGLAMSVYPQYAFSNSGASADDRDLVEPGSAFLLPVQLEKDLGPVMLNLQLGREFRSSGDSWFYGLALSHRVHDKWEFGGELAGTAEPRFNRSSLTLNFGVMIDLNEHASFMFSLGRDLYNQQESRATLVGYVGWQFRL
jgi:hypothetical protein